ncbi:Tetraacyldisaccharide 4'-kinase [subsurface metagenome]
MSIERTWEEYNRNRGFSLPLSCLKIIFSILSCVYLLAYYLRVFLYKLGVIKSKGLEAKVISVGNITLGGTGKTPLVICIGERLKSKGENFAILTRGYKRESKKMVEIMNEELNWKKTGDEPFMLSSELPGVPIFIHKNRFQAGKEALRKYKTRIFILDDGFQHWGLQRDVNIVVIDCLNPFGGGKLFPAGFLREPLKALKRADIFVLNRADPATNMEEIKRVLNRYNPDALKVESLYLLDSIEHFLDHSLVDANTLKGKTFVAFSGIANSLSFEKTLDHLIGSSL